MKGLKKSKGCPQCYGEPEGCENTACKYKESCEYYAATEPNMNKMLFGFNPDNFDLISEENMLHGSLHHTDTHEDEEKSSDKISEAHDLLCEEVRKMMYEMDLEDIKKFLERGKRS
jgi:hypothetical protein